MSRDKLFMQNMEGKPHENAKKKLFDILIEDKIKIKDDLGNEYSILNGIHDDEFLHMESFLINYDNNPIYSSTNPPCIKHFNFNRKDHRLLCNQKGNFGAIEILPCRKCMELNYKIEDFYYFKSPVGFTPDIAYGFNNKHSIWFEIKNTSECSYFKKKFCYENNITLLEIDYKDVKKSANELIFKNLSCNSPVQEEIDNWVIKLNEDVNTHGYAIKTDYRSSLKFLHTYADNEDFEQQFQKLLHENSLAELIRRNSIVNDKLCLPDNQVHLIVSKHTYDKIIKLQTELDTQHKKKIEGDLKLYQINMINEISCKGYAFSRDYKKELLVIFDKLYKDDKYKNWDKFLNENNLKELDRYDKAQYGITIKSYPFIIIKNEQ